MADVYSIAIIEMVSIHKGIEVLDDVLKSSRVKHLLSRTICPGKYIIIVRGELADIEECVERAKTLGGRAIADTAIISRVDERIFPALAGTAEVKTVVDDMLGIIETFSVAAAIKAADAALKEANVTCLRIHPGMAIGGRGIVILTGDIDNVKSGVDAAIERIREDGLLAGYSILVHPHPDLMREFLS